MQALKEKKDLLPIKKEQLFDIFYNQLSYIKNKFNYLIRFLLADGKAKFILIKL